MPAQTKQEVSETFSRALYLANRAVPFDGQVARKPRVDKDSNAEARARSSQRIRELGSELKGRTAKPAPGSDAAKRKAAAAKKRKAAAAKKRAAAKKAGAKSSKKAGAKSSKK